MKKKFALLCGGILLTSTTLAHSAEVQPISAEEAFDSTISQLDPASGAPANVALVDIRTVAETYWVGSPAKVDRLITVDGEEIVPDNGKVQQWRGSNWLVYNQGMGHCSWKNYIHVSDIDSYITSPIATVIPYKNWDDSTANKVDNEEFMAQMQALADSGVESVILMCRSGKRSSEAGAALPDSMFATVYEVDQPDGKNGRGGFQGTSYSDRYNGYRGYPGRQTRNEDNPSVSWQDAGLPMHIGWKP